MGLIDTVRGYVILAEVALDGSKCMIFFFSGSFDFAFERCYRMEGWVHWDGVGCLDGTCNT